MVDNNTCYSPSLFTDSVTLNFTPGGGPQTSTTPLNSAALGWVGSQVSVGAVQGITSGSVSCQVVDGNLVCEYQDGQGCPPPFQGGQCSDLLYRGFADTRLNLPPNPPSSSSQLNFVGEPGPLTVTRSVRDSGTNSSGEPLFSGLIRIVSGDGSVLASSGYDNSTEILEMFANVFNLSASGGAVDNCGDPPGECGNSGNGSVSVTYTGCFPPSEPPSNPPSEPSTPSSEPTGSSPSRPRRGVAEGSPDGPDGPDSYTFTTFWPRTPAATSQPTDYTQPWYPVYGSDPTDDPSWRFYLPPLFTYRDGVQPTLNPWNGVVAISNAPGDTETGVPYRAVYATPSMSLNDIKTNKRIANFSTVFDNRQHNNKVWSALSNTDSSVWGQQQNTMSANLSLVIEEVEGEVAYNLYDFNNITYPYPVYELPDTVVFKETFKGVSNRWQGAVWSQDESVWSLEGFQLQASTKGRNTKRNKRR